MTAEFPEKLAIMFEQHRYKVAYGGRGSAKSWGFARAMLIQGAQRPLRCLCAREVQKSIRDSVHQLLCDQIEALNLGWYYEIFDVEIRAKNGGHIAFSGLSNQTADSLKSFEGIDICWIEEANNVTKRSWNILVPTIRKDGSEIWVTFNPELESDETYQRFVVKPPPDAVVLKMNWRDNPWFPKVLDDERKQAQIAQPDEYDNIWEGVPKRAVDGAIYAREVSALYEERRVRPTPRDPMLRVHTVWDLGWNDATAIGFFQRAGSELRMIDYMEESFVTLDEWAQRLDATKYRFGNAWLPHDAFAKTHASNGRSTADILKALGHKVKPVPNMPINEGIRLARMAFPRLYVDEEKGAPWLESIKRYRRHISTKTDEPNSPVHDKASHGADMWRYAAIVADKMTNDDEQTKEHFPHVASRGGRTGY
ncbi:MAG: PBSX family phage terminase large subunit [Hyphomicrobiaceae bacterium]|nr:MAG: PBSX family phage terminase large subunit [Hyphomicrobiaceae bacterium]